MVSTIPRFFCTITKFVWNLLGFLPTKQKTHPFITGGKVFYFCSSAFFSVFFGMVAQLKRP